MRGKLTRKILTMLCYIALAFYIPALTACIVMRYEDGLMD